MSTADIAKAIAATAELTGTELSAVAIRVLLRDLQAYPESAVLRALERCRRELTGRLTPAAIFARLNEADGRPSADEAWALALDARDERLTVVWTDEIAEAFGVARPVLAAGDKIGARMAFRDAYERIVQQRREAGRAPAWSASLGWDAGQREVALQLAEKRGLLPAPTVAALLPAPAAGGVVAALLGDAAAADGLAANIAARVAKLREALRSSSRQRERVRVEARQAVQADLAARKQHAADLVAEAQR